LAWSRAVHGCQRSTLTTATFFREGAWTSIVTDGAVVFLWIGADTRSRIADTWDVAIIQRFADQVFTTATVALQAGLTRAAGVFVIARNTVKLWRLFTEACPGVTGSSFQAITLAWTLCDRFRRAGSGVAALVLGTFALIVTGHAVGGRWIAATTIFGVTEARHMALVKGSADNRVPWFTSSVFAEIDVCTGVVVVTITAIFFYGIGACACVWNAYADVVAACEGFTNDRLATHALTFLAAV